MRIATDPLREVRFVVPRRHAGTLRRTGLLRQLRSSRDRRLVTFVAPPGYGKTSLLVQWATEAPGPVAWLTADERDNDPVVLLADLATAIDRIERLGPALFAAIASAAVPTRTVVGRLLAGISRPSDPIWIAIDDGHQISSRVCLDILAELVEHLPQGAQMAIAGRELVRLPLERWRADGSLLELGPAELAFDEREAVGLGRELGLRLRAHEAARLGRETEGWPALLVLSLRGGRTAAPEREWTHAGSDHGVAEYLRFEVLERHSLAEITFLTRTSILEHLSAPLCDAVVARRGSSEVLHRLARSTLLVDEYGGSYRYHALLRRFLQRELSDREPRRVATFHRRAAAWYQENGATELAVDHAFAAGDLDLAAKLVGGGFARFHWSGRRATIRSWARRFGTEALEKRPWLAVLAAWEEIAAGDVAATERLARVVERGTFEGRPADGTTSFEAGRGMLRAAMARRGPEDALANAARAVELEADGGSWLDFALWQMAIARLTIGDRDGADAAFAAAVTAARSADELALVYCLLGHRALVATEQGAWDVAAALVEESDTISPTPLVDGYLSTIPSRIVRIRLATKRGDVMVGRSELARAVTLRPLMTAAAPAGAIQWLLALARTHLALDDPEGAHACLMQARGVIRLHPDLGILPAEADTLGASLDLVAPRRRGGSTSLTVAELHILPFLPYYLTFKEIGQRLGVKETTVKTHALGIYLKLGAADRTDAVERAVEVGLLERFWPAEASAPPRGSASRGLPRA